MNKKMTQQKLTEICQSFSDLIRSDVLWDIEKRERRVYDAQTRSFPRAYIRFTLKRREIIPLRIVIDGREMYPGKGVL